MTKNILFRRIQNAKTILLKRCFLFYLSCNNWAFFKTILVISVLYLRIALAVSVAKGRLSLIFVELIISYSGEIPFNPAPSVCRVVEWGRKTGTHLYAIFVSFSVPTKFLLPFCAAQSSSLGWSSEVNKLMETKSRAWRGRSFTTGAWK